MTYRRGFKSEANSTAGEIRTELDLGPLDRLDPLIARRLARSPSLSLSALAPGTAPDPASYLAGERRHSPAATVFRGTRRLIVHNDAHAPGRQNSNLAHDSATHCSCTPRPRHSMTSGPECGTRTIEDEAAWLAGCLLVTEDAALDSRARHVEQGATAAEQLGVSDRMIQFRLNATAGRRDCVRPCQSQRLQDVTKSRSSETWARHAQEL